ncbi:MAG: HNH endonuclease signature motif containing protein [Caldilineaceae bacterium]|nr:HNH endonuclease signature motif containing protein [Caldilineaceae bacterium]
MNEIEIDHRWHEVSKVLLDDDVLRITEKCLDCGVEGEVLDLSPSSRAKEDAVAMKKMPIKGKRSGDPFNEISELLEETRRQLLADTEYTDIGDLMDEINKRCGGEIDARTLPYSVIKRWVNTYPRKYKRKRILAHLQGLVCNRCHSIVFSESQLEIEHITPLSKGNPGSLASLQLLCRECNKRKSDEDPTERDISPINFNGETRVYRLTCVQVADLRRSYIVSKTGCSPEREL